MKFNLKPIMTPSGITLLLVNLVPLAGVIWLNWDVYSILLLYWSENVVIGVLNLLRIALVKPVPPAGHGEKLFLIPFFTLHYGMFTAGHGIFLASLFATDNSVQTGLLTIFPQLLHEMVSRGLLLTGLALAASHLASLLFNYIGKGEYRHTSASRLMTRPYTRVVILHVTLIAGGILIQALHQPLALLVVLIFLKIGVDLRAHRKEHREPTN